MADWDKAAELIEEIHRLMLESRDELRRMRGAVPLLDRLDAIERRLARLEKWTAIDDPEFRRELKKMQQELEQMQQERER
jgi:hypothetical protein